eukprot:261158-Pleurochrysis_carterae.AAC.2
MKGTAGRETERRHCASTILSLAARASLSTQPVRDVRPALQQVTPLSLPPAIKIFGRLSRT